MASVSGYGNMLADNGRMAPYVAALRKAVGPDSVVLDIGTGTGIFALLACQFGARHVYALETNDAIELGRQQAEANGYSEKITFIHDSSSRISLPENMAIGIDVDFLSFYWHRFSSDYRNRGTLRIDSKVGPSFTYITSVDKLAFDVYVKADISWVTATAIVYDDNTDNRRGYAAIGTIGFSTGFNVRYSKLMLGIEFNTISPKLENVDNDGYYLGNVNDSSSDKSPLPSLSFTIGMAF